MMEPPFTLSSKRFNQDYYAGAAMMVIGLGVVVQGSSYDQGSLARMGPGFFPTALGAILVLLGVAIALSATRSKRADFAEKRTQPEWRGWFCITTAIVLFIVIGQYGGLLPSTFVVVFVSAMGDKQNTWRQAAVLALAMVLIAFVVFHWALKVQFPLFQWG